MAKSSQSPESPESRAALAARIAESTGWDRAAILAWLTENPEDYNVDEGAAEYLAEHYRSARTFRQAIERWNADFDQRPDELNQRMKLFFDRRKETE